MSQARDAPNAPLAQPPVPGWLLVLFIAAFLACCGIAIALPHSRYIRFQQFDSTAMRPAGWIYERLHFDRTPIDVAIIGASRTAVGISGPTLQAALGAKLHRTIHVANISMPQDGRDLHYELTKELLATHPEVRLILYSLTEHASRRGHPTFRSIADVGDVLSEPVIINTQFVNNVVYLPYRQLSLFLQTAAPGLFGVHAAFRPARYWGTDHDSSLSHWSAAGNWVNRDAILPEALLKKNADRSVRHRFPVYFPRERDYEYAIERHYTRAVTALARAHGVQIGFVYSPIYAHDMPISDLPFYRARGMVFNAGAIAHDYRNYADYAHLNRIGSTRVSRWLAGRLAAKVAAGQLRLAPPLKAS